MQNFRDKTLIVGEEASQHVNRGVGILAAFLPYVDEGAEGLAGRENECLVNCAGHGCCLC